MVGRTIVASLLLTAATSGCDLVDPRPAPRALTCGEWSRLDADDRHQTAEAFIEPDLMPSVRDRQQLPAETLEEEVLAAVGGSFDKICEIERRPGLLLSEIVTGLYR